MIHGVVAVVKGLVHTASALTCFVLVTCLCITVFLALFGSKAAAVCGVLLGLAVLGLQRMRSRVSDKLKSFEILIELVHAQADTAVSVADKHLDDFQWLTKCYPLVSNPSAIMSLLTSGVHFIKCSITDNGALPSREMFLGHMQQQPSLSTVRPEHVNELCNLIYDQIEAKLGHVSAVSAEAAQAKAQKMVADKTGELKDAAVAKVDYLKGAAEAKVDELQGLVEAKAQELAATSEGLKEQVKAAQDSAGDTVQRVSAEIIEGHRAAETGIKELEGWLDQASTAHTALQTLIGGRLEGLLAKAEVAFGKEASDGLRKAVAGDGSSIEECVGGIVTGAVSTYVSALSYGPSIVLAVLSGLCAIGTGACYRGGLRPDGAPALAAACPALGSGGLVLAMLAMCGMCLARAATGLLRGRVDALVGASAGAVRSFDTERVRGLVGAGADALHSLEGAGADALRSIDAERHRLAASVAGGYGSI
uniref:Uncharacterized protein n=1 Tax=Eutreptiella gymnastica TaxID=73025 RepID=A0A7S4CVJ5_9EUGL